jgi:hypothetical protein
VPAEEGQVVGGRLSRVREEVGAHGSKLPD